MAYDACTTVDCRAGQEMPHRASSGENVARLARPVGVVARIDSALEWATERLDRKFVTAMEECVCEDPGKTRELTALKRTVLVLVSVGLGASAVYMKFATEAALMYLFFN